MPFVIALFATGAFAHAESGALLPDLFNPFGNIPEVIRTAHARAGGIRDEVYTQPVKRVLLPHRRIGRKCDG